MSHPSPRPYPHRPAHVLLRPAYSLPHSARALLRPFDLPLRPALPLLETGGASRCRPIWGRIGSPSAGPPSGVGGTRPWRCRQRTTNLGAQLFSRPSDRPSARPPDASRSGDGRKGRRKRDGCRAGRWDGARCSGVTTRLNGAEEAETAAGVWGVGMSELVRVYSWGAIGEGGPDNDQGMAERFQGTFMLTHVDKY